MTVHRKQSREERGARGKRVPDGPCAEQQSSPKLSRDGRVGPGQRQRETDTDTPVGGSVFMTEEGRIAFAANG